jgi:hypothetical protein
MGLSSFACLLVRLDGSLLAGGAVSHTVTDPDESVRHECDMLAKCRERVKSKKLMTLDGALPLSCRADMPERIAVSMINDAERSGDLKAGGMIVEATLSATPGSRLSSGRRRSRRCHNSKRISPRSSALLLRRCSSPAAYAALASERIAQLWRGRGLLLLSAKN